MVGQAVQAAADAAPIAGGRLPSAHSSHPSAPWLPPGQTIKRTASPHSSKRGYCTKYKIQHYSISLI
jgi:hypothetical protein